MNTNPKPTLYALFVGIDTYQAPVRPLRGCVNDVSRVEALLRERTQGDNAPMQFEPLLLANEAATRPAIIQAFREHLGRAGANDVALFYYSGHGSQEPAPPEFWHLEPDHLNETLVCYDSRQPDGWDLADKELSYLIAQVAKNGPHVAVILDSCHSGSGTRDAVDDTAAEVRVRLHTTDQRLRPLDSYILTLAEADLLQPNKSGLSTPWIALPQGRHILMAACGDNESAKETWIDGEQRGVFSYFLQDTLQSAGETLTYRDLFKRISALVQTKVTFQAPVLEATHADEVQRPFLGGAIVERTPYFTLRQDKERIWTMDGGAMHGVAPPVGSETTVLSLFPFDADLGTLASLRNAVGEARVTSIGATQSEVQVTARDGGGLDPATTYKALVVGQPLAPLVVAFEGDVLALDLVRQALAKAGPGGAPSLLVREGPLVEADYRLNAQGSVSMAGYKYVYRIGRKADAYPMAVETHGFDPAGAALAVARLEHIARWQKLAELGNKSTSIGADEIKVEFFQVDDGGELVPLDATNGLHFEYRPPYEKNDHPVIQIKLANQGTRTYYCMLIDLSQDYSVFVDLVPEGVVRLEPGQEIWAEVRDNKGRLQRNLGITIPTELYEKDVTQLKDIIKLIVSTDKGDATLLSMDKLPMTANRAVTRGAPRAMSTLNRLMARVQTRAIRVLPEDDEPYSDWRTADFISVVERPKLSMLEQLPQRADLPLQRMFTLEEYELIKRGFRPQDMDDKWAIEFDNGWLSFYRTWGAVMVFLLHLTVEAEGVRVDQAYAARDTDMYTGTDTDEEVRLINFMIDRLLLYRPDAVLRKADGTPITGLHLYHEVGNV